MYWKIIFEYYMIMIFNWSIKFFFSNFISKKYRPYEWSSVWLVFAIESVVDERIFFDKTLEIIGRNELDKFSIDTSFFIYNDWVDKEKFIGNNCEIKLWLTRDILNKHFLFYIDLDLFDKNYIYLPIERSAPNKNGTSYRQIEWDFSKSSSQNC